MDAEPIQDLLDLTPFVPFRIKFSNQEAVDIENPDLVVVMKRQIFIANSKRNGFKIYWLMHIVGFETKEAA